MVFIKKVENFICENCKKKVIGAGYTNHCSNCLWSKHVDIYPGDREEMCGGLMKPILLGKTGKQGLRIKHKCQSCGFERWSPVVAGDNFDEILDLR